MQSDEDTMEEIMDGFVDGSNSTAYPSLQISGSPSIYEELVDNADEIHSEDAWAAVFLNITLIVCALLAYYVKINRIYYLPESAAAMIVGVIIGGVATFFLEDLTLWKFSPEFFFFVLLPPIIFEAGYSLQRKHFFDNIGAITLYAMIGTLTSTFIVGFLTFYSGRMGLIKGIDTTNPMEALLFGALISAVDPVATLSIMGSPELHCNELLYSLVFGESVLNDAIAIVLFKTFHKYYDPNSPDFTKSEIPSALLSFFNMTIMSILVGVGLGLLTSYIYKHTSIHQFPRLESTLLFLFCYCCYATAEAFELSGIMALFFNGICLGHYNSYNLSHDSRQATEKIFATLATVTEMIVFLYMGMGVFTGKFKHWNLVFSLLALSFCVIGRAANIFPLSWVANKARRKGPERITYKMQIVLWFAGLRGAIAFALAENMPGPNRETYASVTLTICMITTVICGGFTEKILTKFGMKQVSLEGSTAEDSDDEFLVIQSASTRREIGRVYKGLKGLWKQFDDRYLKEYFGGSRTVTSLSNNGCVDDDRSLGVYELSMQQGSYSGSDDDVSKLVPT